MDDLFEVLSALVPLSEGFKKALGDHLILMSLPQRHLLLEAPKVAEHAFFLRTGYAMSYRYIQRKKQIEHFYKPGRIIVSPGSFFEQVPSRESIQLLEDSDLYYISFHSVMTLLEIFPEATRIYQVTMNLYYEESRGRIYDLQHLSTIECYEKMKEEHPTIEQLVPQEYIASYLGIAPQSLSRIKRTLRDS
jgi:CRP/FNR family transcriptional regulator, anaerobic regulatory protein